MKTIHLPISDTEWLAFKMLCLKEGIAIQEKIIKLIQEAIREENHGGK